MNQPNSSVRCPHCNLLNFASDPFCKRCKNSLQTNNQAGDPNSFNINININSPVQPRLNVTQNNQPQPPPSAPPQQFAPPNLPHLPPPAQISGNDSSEYKLLNQDGFRQWQQEENGGQNPPNNNQTYPPVNTSNYPVPVYPPNYYPANSQTLWRRGSELVMHRYAGTMPDCCVKCGQSISTAGGAFIRQKYRWHNPLVYIALISPLIYIILSAVLSQRGSIEVPLCSRHLEDRKKTGKFLLGGGIAAFLAIFFLASVGSGGFAFLVFVAALIGISLGYEYSYKTLRVSKIDDNYIYLKNADNQFLNRLPPC